MKKEQLLFNKNEALSLDIANGHDINILTKSRSRTRWRFHTFTAVAFLYLCFSISKLFLSCPRLWQKEQPIVLTNPSIRASEFLVPFEAHIMSKCPDAKVCLKEMILPTMQRVSDKVNFTLSYIGSPAANDGVACKHGAEECMGNIIELCAAYLYPEPRIYLGFVMCLTRDYSDIPSKDLIEDCALEHGIDFRKLNDCSSSDDGFALGLLRSSVVKSRDLGVTISCTVRLNEEVYCIHDGGWRDCPSGPSVNDLVTTIEKLYHDST